LDAEIHDAGKWKFQSLLGTIPDYSTGELFINQYSMRQITYQSDLLTAISGIVKLMQKQNAGAYISGLWVNNLLPGLLWYVSYSAARSKTYPNPTWPWVSIDGAIEYAGHMSTYGESAAKLQTRYDSQVERIDCDSGGFDSTTNVCWFYRDIRTLNHYQPLMQAA
jgi:hypothetical protein